GWTFAWWNRGDATRRASVYTCGRYRLELAATGPVHIEQPLRIAPAGEHDFSCGACDHELGRACDDRLNPDRLVLYDCVAVSASNSRRPPNRFRRGGRGYDRCLLPGGREPRTRAWPIARLMSWCR